MSSAENFTQSAKRWYDPAYDKTYNKTYVLVTRKDLDEPVHPRVLLSSHFG